MSLLEQYQVSQPLRFLSTQNSNAASVFICYYWRKLVICSLFNTTKTFNTSIMCKGVNTVRI